MAATAANGTPACRCRHTFHRRLPTCASIGAATGPLQLEASVRAIVFLAGALPAASAASVGGEVFAAASVGGVVSPTTEERSCCDSWAGVRPCGPGGFKTLDRHRRCALRA